MRRIQAATRWRIDARFGLAFCRTVCRNAYRRRRNALMRLQAWYGCKGDAATSMMRLRALALILRAAAAAR